MCLLLYRCFPNKLTCSITVNHSEYPHGEKNSFLKIWTKKGVCNVVFELCSVKCEIKFIRVSIYAYVPLIKHISRYYDILKGWNSNWTN